MVKVGIDAICFYTSNYYLDLITLAKIRGIDPQKYTVGLGQKKISIAPPGEDAVTLAANAASHIVEFNDCSEIEMLLFATESGVDHSKAAGLYLHGLLGLTNTCRVIELKQACYSMTAAIQLASSWVKLHPSKKALLIASDIARYELNSPGEPTQGCGAVAILISVDPRILVLEEDYGIYTNDIMDFWRPLYRDEALVDGHFSTEMYINSLKECWFRYQAMSGRDIEDHFRFCYHTPYIKMVEKAHKSLLAINELPVSSDIIKQHTEDTMFYNMNIGNSYNASLYVGLCCLLDQSRVDLSGKRISLYSYGSGSMSELYSGVVCNNYKSALSDDKHALMLDNRQELTYEEYEKFHYYRIPQDDGVQYLPDYSTGNFKLAEIRDHKRIYKNKS